MRPNTCKVVSLKFQANAQLVGFNLASLLLHPLDFHGESKKILNVVSDFMSDHISHRKFTLSTQLVFHRSEEVEIEVNVFITRAVKRANCCCCIAAGRTYRTGE